MSPASILARSGVTAPPALECDRDQRSPLIGPSPASVLGGGSLSSPLHWRWLSLVLTVPGRGKITDDEAESV